MPHKYQIQPLPSKKRFAIKYHIVTFIIGAIATIGAMLLAHEAHDVVLAEYCAEDMACWDCETMGNMICGKV